MRFWFVACLLVCLVLPVGAEPPSPEITPEEAKAIAKEAVREVLDSLEEIREETRVPSEGEEIDLCGVHAWLGHGSDGYPDSAAKRTDHLRPCPPIWRMNGGGRLYAGERFIIAEGYPHGKMRMECDQNGPDEIEIQVSIFFKEYWNHDFPYSTKGQWLTRVRRKEDRVHLQLGFSSKVQTNGDGEGFNLKQTTLDYDWPHRPWPVPPGWSWTFDPRKVIKEQKHTVVFYGQEAAALMRTIYHSEAFSWTDRKIGETNTVLVGETVRPNFGKLLDFCGIDPDGPLLSPRESLSSPSQASQR